MQIFNLNVLVIFKKQTTNNNQPRLSLGLNGDYLVLLPLSDCLNFIPDHRFYWFIIKFVEIS